MSGAISNITCNLIPCLASTLMFTTYSELTGLENATPRARAFLSGSFTMIVSGLAKIPIEDLKKRVTAFIRGPENLPEIEDRIDRQEITQICHSALGAYLLACGFFSAVSSDDPQFFSEAIYTGVEASCILLGSNFLRSALKGTSKVFLQHM